MGGWALSVPVLLAAALAAANGAAGEPTIADERRVPAYVSPDGGGTMRLLLEPAGEEAFLGRVTFRPGAEMPAHRHPDSEELVYVLSGRVTLKLGDRTLLLSAGMAVRIPAGVEHGFRVEGDEPVEAVNVYVPGGPEQRFKTWTRRPEP